MGEANSGKISLKLLVDRNAKRVIFGEAGKEFVDFLFNFLSLPVGTIVKLVSKDKMVGSLGKIYESIEAMHVDYMEPSLNKEDVLNPKVSSSSLATTPFLLGYKTNDGDLNGSKLFYRCHNASYSGSGVYEYESAGFCKAYVCDDPKAVCRGCNCTMDTELIYVHGPGKEATKVEKGSGYVKGLVTYMVMDNLEVKPMSTISTITLLSTFKVKDLPWRLWRFLSEKRSGDAESFFYHRQSINFLVSWESEAISSTLSTAWNGSSFFVTASMERLE